MNISKVSANGQVTVPIEIRKKLRLGKGDKLAFKERENGEIMVFNASGSSKHKAKGAAYGILKKYANPEMISLEEGAWERAATEEYRKNGLR